MVGGGDEEVGERPVNQFNGRDLKTVLLSKPRTSESTSSLHCQLQTQPWGPPGAVEILVEAEGFLLRIEMGI